jgi:aminoglycoside phosphotransferase (APT) family kinase protein
MAVSRERDQGETRAALAAWLAERTEARDVSVGEISTPGLSGFSNETLLFDATWDDGTGPTTRGLVLRVEPSGHQVFPSTAFEEQVRVLRALASDGSVPVPEVLWLEEDRSVLGDRFLAMPRVDGQVPADNPSYHADGWVVALGEAERAALWEAGIDAMAAVHRVDRAAADLGWVEAPTPADQLDRDRTYRTFAAGEVPYPPVDRAVEVLAATVPPAVERPALCWGDARIGNMIFAADCTVAAVLDWEMVTAGDPVQDLAWYLLLDRHHHEAFGVPRLPGFPDRAQSIARWEAASGRSAEHLGWYELLAGVRYAAIMTRVMTLLDASGVFPGAAEIAYDQTGSQLLERLLDERS